ncbi:MAG: DUF3455 domain-containing protein [Methylobacter sp.]|nr:DUF3455 domain-containing protein [Methylobacter sp.]
MLKHILLLWGLLQTTAYAQDSIPEQITVPVGNNLVLSAHAQGDQIYQCTLNEGAYSWKLKAPDADLFDTQGQLIGHHYEGPTWEYKDGSRIVGRVISKIDIEPGSAISWLLVEVIDHKGQGVFSNVRFINRINTHGGVPPLEGCDPNHPGSEKRIAYIADYIFYAPE